MSEEVSNTIKGGVKQFTDNLSNSKSFKKFKNRATKFGETGQFNVKDFKNLGEPLMKDFKKHGKGALLNTLKNLSTHLEGNRTKCHGVSLSGSGNKKDMSKGQNEPCPVDYRAITAKNNKKKEVISSSYNHYSWRDSFTPTEIESFDIIKPEPLVSEGKKKGLDGKACWKGYKLDGTKKKDGKTVDNCVKVDEGVASVVAKKIPWEKVATKVGGAVLAAKSGEEILKGLLGTPGKPKATDWDKNPKDKIDQELNVRQGQAKDAAKNKGFDKEMKAYRKGKKNLSDEEKVQRLKDAAAKYRGKKK